ncbi:uncharacterized protein LOC134694528 [Mytilus trossulus]|uniref:uncharacterized protein LOC134694528 n=1 Tax=Mytilus trossulus TaxID=6551 RepID=UPI003004B130
MVLVASGSLCLLVLNIIILVGASHKKGVGIAWSPQYHCTDEATFTNTHWWYDWRQSPERMHFFNHCPVNTRAGYVPMVNGRHFEKGINISSQAQYLLGFNEPDHHDQSNLTVAQAVVMWRELEKHASGKILVSPAVTNLNWLQHFLHQCHNCRVDHVAVHIYRCDAHQIMTKLKQTWDKFHKPIWLTEFACPHTTSVNYQLRLMREVLPLLESAPYVFRYAWFVSRWLHHNDGNWVDGSASLMKENSAELSTLGHYYNNFMSGNSTKDMKGRNRLAFQINENNFRYLKSLVMLQNKHEREESLTIPYHRKSFKANCSSSGGHLASIETAEENTFVLDVIVLIHKILKIPAFFWIGLTDNNEEMSYKWLSGAPLTFNNWYQGPPQQPDNKNGDGLAGAHCALIVINLSLKWSDEFCNDAKLLSVCEIR